MISAMNSAGAHNGETVVFRRQTSRVYSIPGQCAEERRRTADWEHGIEEHSITRMLGDQSVTLLRTRNLRHNVESTQRSAVKVRDEEEPFFHEQWMKSAAEWLPPAPHRKPWNYSIESSSSMPSHGRARADRFPDDTQQIHRPQIEQRTLSKKYVPSPKGTAVERTKPLLLM